jgi:mannose-6-phosphate isomerase-like protein (cupin superfamily)
MQIIERAGRYTPAPGGEPNHWAEHMASTDLSVGTYSVPAGGLDDQDPHTEDEIYVVQTGTATLVTDSGTAEVGPGSVIFVPAHERHQFTNVGGDLAVLVIFAPPYNSRKRAAARGSS